MYIVYTYYILYFNLLYIAYSAAGAGPGAAGGAAAVARCGDPRAQAGAGAEQAHGNHHRVRAVALMSCMRSDRHVLALCVCPQAGAGAEEALGEHHRVCAVA